MSRRRAAEWIQGVIIESGAAMHRTAGFATLYPLTGSPVKNHGRRFIRCCGRVGNVAFELALTMIKQGGGKIP